MYFSTITKSYGSPFLEKFVTRDLASCSNYGDNCKRVIELGMKICDGSKYVCKYEIQEKLQVVEIYFDSPTFDKITRDAKTNNIARLSMIGGTLGLLTGE